MPVIYNFMDSQVYSYLPKLGIRFIPMPHLIIS